MCCFKQYSENTSAFISDPVPIHVFVSFTLLVISLRTPVSLTCELKELLNYALWRTSQHALHLNELSGIFLIMLAKSKDEDLFLRVCSATHRSFSDEN